MSDLLKIALTSACTVLGGISIFVLQNFLVDPLGDQARVLGRLAYLILYHAERYANPLPIPQNLPPDELSVWLDLPHVALYQEAKTELRKCASELFSATNAIRAYSAWALFGVVPKKQQVEEAISLIIGISNALFVIDPSFKRSDMLDNCRSADRIKYLLRLNRVRAR